MLVVTGATGVLGSKVVAQLLARGVPAATIRVSVRDASKAKALSDQGVCVRQASFSDVASLHHAFEGADRLLLVSANESGPAIDAMRANMVQAAAGSGARRIFYTSHQGVSLTSAFPPMVSHAKAEADLAAAAPGRFTPLRNGFYASTALMMVDMALATGKLVAPRDGPMSWACHDDLAEAAAILLSAPDEEAARLLTPGLAAPPLTGAEALDLAAVASLMAAASGKAIVSVPVEDDAHVAAMAARGVPPERAQIMLGMFRASRAGEFRAVDGALGRILGRPPRSMREQVVAHVAAKASAAHGRA